MQVKLFDDFAPVFVSYDLNQSGPVVVWLVHSPCKQDVGFN